jgi:hypothetical protein
MDTCFSEELNETEQAIIKTLTFLGNNVKQNRDKADFLETRLISGGEHTENGKLKEVDVFNPNQSEAYLAKFYFFIF